MFNKKYNFGEKPTKQEIDAIEEAVSFLGKEGSYNDSVADYLAEKFKADREITSRAVYRARHEIRRRRMQKHGYTEMTIEKLQVHEKNGDKIILKVEGIFGATELKLTPKEIDGAYYWMKPRAKKTYVLPTSILNNFYKLA